MDRSNLSFQARVSERQRYIQQSTQMEDLHVEIIEAIAEFSERAKDPGPELF